ncbi:MAG TPA: ParB/RepB/Spo0J family partition protein [Terriglobales bacterium]|jgi:ParB/RepB/Spo0J family partition protein|nr:ParB/RepB/Spo0J family partition protein [Terriglobales bacterium]
MPVTRHVSLAEIDPPPIPARMAMDDGKLAELRASMQEIGLLQAIGVVAKDGRYEIEYGHRRYTCACDLGWATIECKVFTPAEIASGAAMLAENIYHEELSAAEEALLFQEHRELYGLDEAALCARFKKSPDYIGDRIRLLRGDPLVFDALSHRRITFAVARELNKCDDQAHRRYLLDVAVTTGYSSRVMADHVRQWRSSVSPQQAPGSPPPQAELPAPAPEYRQECCLCGGYRDPWAMVNVMIHKHELDAIREQIERAAREVG